MLWRVIVCKPYSVDICGIHNVLFMQGLPLLLKRIQIFLRRNFIETFFTESFYLIFSKYVMSIFRTEHYMETWFAMAMAIRCCFHIFLLWDRLSYIDCLGSGNSPNPIILILLKKGFSLGSRSRIIKVFWFFEKNAIERFYSSSYFVYILSTQGVDSTSAWRPEV